MPKRTIPNWLLVLLIPIALILLVPVLWLFVSLTAKPLHPTPESVPTVRLTPPQPKWAAAAEQAKHIVRVEVSGQNLPGASVAVAAGGDLVWAEGFGFADLKTSTHVTPDHQFRIGTASEALTSAAAGLLLEKDRLKLDEEIQTYVPTFPKNTHALTLRNVMAHAPGITPDDNDEPPLFTKHCEQPLQAVQHFKSWLLLDQPRTKYQFSIYNWILVSAAIESVAGQPFLKYMREQIFEPLGMRATAADSEQIEAGEDFPLVNLARELIHDPQASRDTNSNPEKRPAPGRVTSYFPRFASDPNHGMHLLRPLDYSCYAGSSAFVSTPSDLVRFGTAMSGAKFLQPSTVGLLQTPQKLDAAEDTYDALGWYRKTVTLAGKPTPAIGQNGDAMDGMVATLLTFPEHGLVVAVTSNISFADTFSIAVKAAEPFAKPASNPATVPAK